MSGNTGVVAAAIDNQPALWVLAVVLYGIGDTVTTLLGLHSEGVTEGGPVALFVFGQGGVPGFLLLKIGFVGTCFLVWYLVRTPGRVAIPLALAVVGAVVTCWNLFVILS
ncbi:hypothetical protein GRX03_11080 [Halovenus sp. WSH3]|uniref:DUF5658 domain-containing protein n=1 Tax=Halovenus carboxidivorans TaxID=2692199 RepID=A0A6B0TB63_9EURY|nr:hypothetical protein [Halovenus carboxidivorans]